MDESEELSPVPTDVHVSTSIRSVGSGRDRGAGSASVISEISSSCANSNSSSALLKQQNLHVDVQTHTSILTTKLNFSNLKTLYGREKEIKFLFDAAHAILPNKEKEEKPQPLKRKILWIKGGSGSGKTTLAWTLALPVARLGGLFCSIKFDVRRADKPFVGIQDMIEILGEQILALRKDEVVRNSSAEEGSTSSPANGGLVRGLTTASKGSGTTPPNIKDPEKLFCDVQKAIQAELAKELPFLVGYFPILRHIVQIKDKNEGSNQPDRDMVMSNDGNASANQLKFTLGRLLAVLCAHVPLVLHFDDVQWADPGSMDMLQNCMMDTSISNLLVLACYRDNHAKEAEGQGNTYNNQGTHHIGQVEKALQASQEERRFGIDTINVQDLSVESVQDMLLDLLSREPKVTQELAQVLHEKTKGNIFYVKQLLLDLQARNLLYFSIGDMMWHWDIQAVIANSSATENVVDLIYGQIHHSKAARQILPVAACLGGTFSSRVLMVVLDELQNSRSDHSVFYNAMVGCINNNDQNNKDEKLSKTDLIGQLKTCMEGGFITLNEEGELTFIHDKIQEGSLSLLPEDKIQECCFRIAKILSSKLEGEALEEHIFTIVNLFDRGGGSEDDSSCPTDNLSDQQQMVHLYCLAGKKARAVSATQSAEKHFIKAIDWLPDTCWTNSFDETLELYSEAAEVSYCLGNVENMRKFCNVVIERDGVTPFQKMRCYDVLIDCLATIESKPLEAVNLGLEILSIFGCKVPKGLFGCGVSAAFGLTRMKYTKKLKDPVFLASLPRCNNPEITAITNILVKLSNASYYCRTDLSPLFHLKLLEMTVKHGITNYSPISFSSIGFILAAFMDDFQEGRKFGEQAIRMVEKVDDRKIIETRTAFVANAYVFPWSQHLKNSLKPLLENYKIGMSHGDTLHAMYAACFYIECSFYSGVHLKIMNHNCEVYSRQMKDYSQISTLIPVLINRQAVQNLMGMGAEGNTTTLTGEILDQEEQLQQYPDIFNTCILQRCRIFLCLYFGEYELGADLAFQWGEKVLQTLPGQPITIFIRLSGAVCCYEMARKTKQNKKYLKEAKRLSKIIKHWAEKPTGNNPNCYHHDLLLDAEAAAFKGKSPIAYKNYESAILMAGRRGYLADQALGNELFANYCAEVGDASEAEFRVNEACRLYEEWGARRKVELLRQRFQAQYPNIDLATTNASVVSLF